MRYSHLAFIRTKYAWQNALTVSTQADRAPSDPRPVKSRMLTTHDSVIIGFDPEPWESHMEAIFGEKGPPSSVEFFEVVQVGLYVAYAPPFIEMGQLHEDLEPFEVAVSRESEFLIRRLLPTSQAQPARQRKLLVVILEEGLDDARISRVDDKIKRALGESRMVWQGRDLRGHCFTHPLKCQDVADSMGVLRSDDNIADYFIIEPIDVPLTTQAISPLKDWVTAGYARMGPATFQTHRRDRGGQRGA